MTISRHNRREFLKLTGLASTGLILSACTSGSDGALPQNSRVRANVFITIESSGQVILVAARSEMGQGVRSSLPQILADELDADWQQVSVVQAVGDERYGNQDTDGSRSIRNHYQSMRELGASARYLLVAAAAQQWSVEPQSCHADLHKVVHAATGKQLGYGELVNTAKRIVLAKNFQAPLKSPQQFRYIGQSVPHIDGRAIATGNAQYGIDTQIPGMLHAVVRRSPVVGGSVESFSDDATRKINGVVDVLAIPGRKGPPGFHPQAGVAVIANNSWSAQKGRAQLTVEWRGGKKSAGDSEAYLRQLQSASHAPGSPVRNQGDIQAAFDQATTLVEADYLVPYLAHATMEPPVATAWVRDGQCEVWAPTQNPQGARKELAKFLDIDEADITVNVTLLGGGFGRKSKPDFILEAAWLSRATEAPVKLLWSREDDIQHDYYHAASAQYLKAGLDKQGLPTAWLHRSIYPAISTTFNTKADNLGELGLGCVDMPYAIPNVRIEGGGPEAQLRIGWLRSVGNIQHAFAINSFVHELAVAAGRDPAQYLLAMLGQDRQVELGKDSRYSNYGMPLEDFPIDTARLRVVTEMAMAAANWGSELPAGHGIGIAAHRSFLSYIASVVEVASDEQGKITVQRVVSAADVGRVINPDRLRSQMEGGALFGLSLALYGEISIAEGRVEQSNFHDYPLLRMHQSPAIDIQLVDSEHAPTGAGEPPTPPIAGALCNAVYDATGRRIRRLPLSRHGLA